MRTAQAGAGDLEGDSGATNAFYDASLYSSYSISARRYALDHMCYPSRILLCHRNKTLVDAGIWHALTRLRLTMI